MNSLAHDSCCAELVRRLRTLRPDSPRRWGRMSSPQMVSHLSDSFRMMTGEKTVSESRERIPRAALKLIALYAPMRWPPEIHTRPELDQLVDGRSPGEFAADLAEVEAFILQLPQQPASQRWPSHPMFGSMSRRDWMRWGYLHVDHHLRQFGV